MQQVNQNRALRQVDNFLHKNIKSQKPAVQNVNLKSQVSLSSTGTISITFVCLFFSYCPIIQKKSLMKINWFRSFSRRFPCSRAVLVAKRKSQLPSQLRTLTEIRIVFYCLIMRSISTNIFVKLK